MSRLWVPITASVQVTQRVPPQGAEHVPEASEQERRTEVNGLVGEAAGRVRTPGEPQPRSESRVKGQPQAGTLHAVPYGIATFRTQDVNVQTEHDEHKPDRLQKGS
jgi:hypothetical protein